MHRILVGLVATALVLAGACSDDGPDPEAGGAAEVLGEVDEGVDGVHSVRVYYESPVHFDGEIPYEVRPPAGGMHAPVWANCGFHDTPVPDENAVHALEHGAVWIAYSPDLDATGVEAIHLLVRANPKVLAAPYDDLEPGEAVVATAWARQLRLTSADDPRLAQFVERYQDSENAPEAGAGCTGTPVGQPIP
jgi:hypothetical protein